MTSAEITERIEKGEGVIIETKYLSGLIQEVSDRAQGTLAWKIECKGALTMIVKEPYAKPAEAQGLDSFGWDAYKERMGY